MIKRLLCAGFFMAGVLSGNAQIDTLTQHFAGGTPTVYGSQGGGFVMGNNTYGDLAKMQLFDSNYGVTGPGTITEVLLWIPVKEDNGGSYDVKIWEDNAGTPGTELASQTVSIANTDTAAASIMLIAGGAEGAYNVSVSFSQAIPTGQAFWAGIVLPTTTGDTIGLASTTDPEFADGATHVGEWWNDMSFHTIGDPNNWNLNIAAAIFPVVDIQVGVEENMMESVSIYPNPATDVVTVNTGNTNADAIQIVSLDGRTVYNESSNAMMNRIDVSNLSKGIYFVRLFRANEIIGTKKVSVLR